METHFAVVTIDKWEVVGEIASTIDAEEYGLSPVDRILSILKWMVVGDSS